MINFHYIQVQNEILIGSLKSEITSFDKKEAANQQQLSKLTFDLERAKWDCRLSSEELEKKNVHLEHSCSDLVVAQEKIKDLELIAEENLTLKRSVMSLEKHNKVIIHIYIHQCCNYNVLTCFIDLDYLPSICHNLEPN